MTQGQSGLAADEVSLVGEGHWRRVCTLRTHSHTHHPHYTHTTHTVTRLTLWKTGMMREGRMDNGMKEGKKETAWDGARRIG